MCVCVCWSLALSIYHSLLQDCSRTPEDCLSIKCTITQLQGLQANEAKVTLRGYVDERFFFVRMIIFL